MGKCSLGLPSLNKDFIIIIIIIINQCVYSLIKHVGDWNRFLYCTTIPQSIATAKLALDATLTLIQRWPARLPFARLPFADSTLNQRLRKGVCQLRKSAPVA